jgi:type VII secretion integral membrane protein EccD
MSTDTGLAKVLVVSPDRQLDLALPEHLPVAALLPVLLRQGGDDLAADGAGQGGWVLRRSDGVPLDSSRTLAENDVRDGELLHLVPGRTVWPQLQYDDIVDVIADGARGAGAGWTPSATRAAGLAAAVGAVLLVPVLVILRGAPWALPGAVLLGLAAVVLLAGVVLARALGDSAGGAVLGATCMPLALAGGALVLGGDLPIMQLGAPHLLLGSAALLLVSALGYAGIADVRRLFVAGLTVAVGGALAAGLTLTWTDGTGAAAVVVTLALIIGPGVPLLSVRLAHVPLPAVPRDAADLRAADQLPPVDRVMEQVGRSLELLAGALLGLGIVTVAGCVALAASGRTSALVLAGVVSGAQVLRGRMLVAIRQRLPLVVSGGLGLAVTVIGWVVVGPAWALYAVVLPALLVLALAAMVAGRAFAARPPSPYLGRIADLLDVVLTLAAGPLAAGVVGLYAVMRGLSG